MVTSTTKATLRWPALSSNRPPMSTFETPFSTSSPQSLERPLQRACLCPSMARPSRIHPLRSKVVNKPRNWWKEGSSKRKGIQIPQRRGFFSEYFEGKSWSECTEEVYQAVQNKHVEQVIVGSSLRLSCRTKREKLTMSFFGV